MERHDRIQAFQPEKYWVISAAVRVEGGRTARLDWERVRVFEREVAQLLLDRAAERAGAPAVASVLAVTTRERSRPRPLALNTVELMRACSAGLGMGPHHAMQVAERLYIRGYISYPRTETSAYPPSFDLRAVLEQQRSSRHWGEHARALLAGGLVRPKGGKDVGDHPPITPMRAASELDLGGDEWRLFDYVTRHFIGTLSGDLKYLQTTTQWAIGDERFSSTGKEVTERGFTEVMHWLAPRDDEAAPRVAEGDRAAVDQLSLGERQTAPPGPLTESDLIGLMEKHGIGTDASIPVHINNICERNFVKVGSGRTLQPTPLGIVLVHGYHKIDPELVLPTMRAAVEAQLDMIAAGKADYGEVLRKATAALAAKFEYFEARIGRMDELFEVSFSPLKDTGRPMSKCPKCRRFMKYIAQKPARLYCATCDETLSLPNDGKIMLYKELKCPLDGYELLLFSTGARGAAFPFCPLCYNTPPFEGMRKGTGCNGCTHPTCAHSRLRHGVCPCAECETGTLVLDPTSPPRWRMACNTCKVVVHFFEGAHRVSVTDALCECGAAQLQVVWNKVKPPPGVEGPEHTGCPFCDELLAQFVEFRKAVNRHPMHKRGRGRGKGGRGRGGRGRGGGAKGKMAELDNYFV